MMMTKVTAETSPEGVMAGLFAAVDVIGRDHFHKSPSPAKFHKSPLTETSAAVESSPRIPSGP